MEDQKEISLNDFINKTDSVKNDVIEITPKKKTTRTRKINNSQSQDKSQNEQSINNSSNFQTYRQDKNKEQEISKVDLEVIKNKINEYYDQYPEVKLKREVKNTSPEYFLAELMRIESYIFNIETIKPWREMFIKLISYILVYLHNINPKIFNNRLVHNYIFLLKNNYINIFDEDFKEILQYVPNVQSLPLYQRIPLKLCFIYSSSVFLLSDHSRDNDEEKDKENEEYFKNKYSNIIS